MVYRKVLSLCLIVCFVTLENSNEAQGRKEELGWKQKLKFPNKPQMKSIQYEDGNVLDCVFIKKQPAFDHPLLKNHTIQIKPNWHPKLISSEDNLLGKSFKVKNNGDKCPSGTVPIPRTQNKYPVKAKPFTRKNDVDLFAAENDHAYHFAFLQTKDKSDRKLFGASGVMKLFNPRVKDNQFSQSHIQVQNDHHEFISVGWAVNPQLYGDNHTHLSAYWGVDRKEGCWNYLCPGFIQTSKKYHLGQVYEKTSVIGGKQYEELFIIYQDAFTRNWWLVVSDDKEAVGYWPKELFPRLAHSALRVTFGGQVFHHTTEPSPEMGSGRAPSEGFRYACDIKNPQVLDEQNNFQFPGDLIFVLYEDVPDCYRTSYSQNDEEIYFGGPGGC